MRADAAIPMLFVLAVFLIALGTDGYAYGVVASLLSVLAVNFAFTAAVLHPVADIAGKTSSARWLCWLSRSAPAR